MVATQRANHEISTNLTATNGGITKITRHTVKTYRKRETTLGDVT